LQAAQICGTAPQSESAAQGAGAQAFSVQAHWPFALQEQRLQPSGAGLLSPALQVPAASQAGNCT
jgi:hypothetical protein